MASPEAMDEMNSERAAFWASLAAEMDVADDTPRSGQEQHFALGNDLLDDRVRLVMSLSQTKTSVYMVARSDAAKLWIAQHQDALAAHLRERRAGTDAEIAQGHWFRRDDIKNDVTLRSRWAEMRRWLRAQHMSFNRAVIAVQNAEE